jgi:hypothetical protein
MFSFLSSLLRALCKSVRGYADARYEHADGLVGVYREQEDNTSKALTLDLRQVSHGETALIGSIRSNLCMHQA